jgi:phosphoenolpyruvate carboxykinase (diphosphate)
MVLGSTLGLFTDSATGELDAHTRRRQVLLLLLASGLPVPSDGEADFEELCKGFHESFREKARLLGEHRCPADQRIEAYLQSHFDDLNLSWIPRLPSRSLILDQYGIARELSLPIGEHSYKSELLTSYRVKNGVLHNPKSDRRTTQGTFHVAEGGLPVPGDKKAVPKAVFAELFRRAVMPPIESLTLPFAARQKTPVRTFVSLLLRPIVCPEVPGYCPKKTMEIRFFVPGSLVSNLDFVESIFGNGGNPFLPRNDVGLDVEHWTGHTGCVILAPHLTTCTKKELGLPRFQDATDRQKRDGMCWKSDKEIYNDGTPFKITCRSSAGVIVTILADNYYGYCKKEVKTQISYAANLYGNVEEEHAGGAIAFATFSFGDEYQAQSVKINGRTFEDVKRDYGQYMDIRPEGYGIDRKYPDLIYVPEDARASVVRQQVWWTYNGKEQQIPLLPGKVYVTPSGFKVRMEKHPGAPSWRIVGARGEGTFCHKPCTVSGGGKSEISKSLRDYMIYGPIFVTDLQRDLDLVDQIFKRDCSNRWHPNYANKPSYALKRFRPLLSPERSLGSVIKMLSPSSDYSDEYNNWLASIPNYIYPIVFIIKRFYKPEWNGDWRSHFGVDIVNGFPGNELKFKDRKLIGTYLRVGLLGKAVWRTYKVRQDFAAASKIQTEDDISASVVVPTKQLVHEVPAPGGMSRKFAVNCEYRLFQRPDDAIHRGLDKQTEMDMARSDNFISNFEPLTSAQAQAMVEKVTEFDQFTAPMQKMIKSCARDEGSLVVSSANPRLVDGKPSKNPRYLQIRPDLIDPMSLYVAERGMRLYYAIPPDEPVLWPVDSVLIGRRNNPAEPAANIRGLAVYSPIHYQELPELFMDMICSLTGKSPSTTGAGSEGALTKSPFNALRPTIDLNNALVSHILTGLGGFSTAAGYIGPKVRVDHDISLLIPEIWCRMTVEDRIPATLISNGLLEPLRDFDHLGEKILASRLGYRITSKFVQTFFGRVFDNPTKIFDDAILRPETQDREAFIDGVKNIVEAQQRVASEYLKDGSIEDACPPLKALITIMATGSYDGKDAWHPDIRAMFTLEYLLASDWYRQRLKTKQRKDIALWKRHLDYLDGYVRTSASPEDDTHLDLSARRALAAAELQRVSSPDYLQSLVGTLGADPTGG